MDLITAEFLTAIPKFLAAALVGLVCLTLAGFVLIQWMSRHW